MNEVTPGQGRRMVDRLDDKLGLLIDSLEGQGRSDKYEFLRSVFEATFGLIPEAEKGSLYELEGELFRPIFCRGYDMETLSRIAFTRDEAFIDFSIDLDSAIHSYETRIRGRDPSRFSSATMEAFERLGTLSGFTSLYAPINVDGRTLGLISLEKFSEGPYSSLSRKVLGFYARLISQFYAQKLEQEREAKRYREIIDALVSAIEVMDKYTEGHARRVVDLSVATAGRLGLAEHEIAEIADAAVLHDVGKLGVPSDIIRKSGALDPAEYEIVKLHCAHSRKILGEIGGFERIAELAYRHHERYDGKGYPEGLAGDAVPLGAYVIGIADSFDAMTSDRSYRPALSSREAIAVIERETGRQFHPEVARVFLGLLEEEGRVGP